MPKLHLFLIPNILFIFIPYFIFYLFPQLFPVFILLLFLFIHYSFHKKDKKQKLMMIREAGQIQYQCCVGHLPYTLLQ